MQNTGVLFQGGQHTGGMEKKAKGGFQPLEMIAFSAVSFCTKQPRAQQHWPASEAIPFHGARGLG